MPAGDWLWPAIWFMPKDNVYGAWPSSGEIDLVESRGNRELVQKGINIGNEQIGSTLHFGPYARLDAWPAAQFIRNSLAGNGWANEIHRYQMEWTPGKSPCIPYILIVFLNISYNFMQSTSSSVWTMWKRVRLKWAKDFGPAVDLIRRHRQPIIRGDWHHQWLLLIRRFV